MNLEEFSFLTRSRRAIRHFKSDPLPDGLLDRLLDVARWAPSGYNIQPVHFVVVTDAFIRPTLRKACMDQAQIGEAPAVVVFTADRRVARNNFARVVAMEREAGAINERYENLLRRVVPLAFGTGPLGIGKLMKILAEPVLRLFMATPEIPAAHERVWLNRQTALSAMTFMLAAQAAGLGTCPMEGFDESRVKRVLRIPSHHIVPIVVPVGYPVEGPLKKTRLPLEGMLHRERW